MARKQAHEDHVNHEAWAIPYGDLITLLLAFFVVMYAVSSINEGKYRVLSDALSKAFGGPPKSIKPIQMGHNNQRGEKNDAQTSPFQDLSSGLSIGGTLRDLRNPQVMPGRIRSHLPQQQVNDSGNTGYKAGATAAYNNAKAEMNRMAGDVERALSGMIAQDLVTVRRTELWLEIEIKTDVLFGSGSAVISQPVIPALQRLAGVLRPFQHRIRVEGYTDNVPMHSAVYPSNWELSSARAAGVVHLFMQAGIAPERMSVLGYGQYQPVADNATADGRNRNRRVLIVVLAEPEMAQEWLRRQSHAEAAPVSAALEAPADARRAADLGAETASAPLPGAAK